MEEVNRMVKRNGNNDMRIQHIKAENENAAKSKLQMFYFYFLSPCVRKYVPSQPGRSRYELDQTSTSSTSTNQR